MYRLKELRAAQRMSQEELSRKSGVSRTIISRLESEKEYTTLTSTLTRLAAALGVKTYELFYAKTV